MKDPPDDIGRKPQTQQLINIDKTKHLKNTSLGPKYLIMSRTNSNDTLANVSPFLLKKTIDYVCGGEVTSWKKLRNGTLLIITKNFSQANNLVKLISISPTIKVEVNEHPTLNYSKGVIYSNDLRYVPESEILEELAKQDVAEVKKIMKMDKNELVETGLIIITFSVTKLPTEIYIG